MIVQEHSVTIDLPVEDVFAYVAEPTNEPDWHHDVVEVHVSSDGPLRLGTTVSWKVRFLGLKDYRIEVTAFEPDRLIEITTREGPVKPRLTHRFEPVQGSTRYTRRVEIQPQGLFWVLQPILRVMPSPNARWARNLKQVLEQGIADGGRERDRV